MERKKTLAYIFLIGTIIVWGISFVSMKLVLEVFSPVALAFVRFVIATSILVVIMLKTSKEKVEKKDLKLMALSGFLGITLYFWCENNGVMRISANSSSIIVATLPVGTLIAEAIAYKTKITMKSVMSILLSFIGVYFVIGNDKLSGSTLGYIFMFGSIAAWSLYMIFTKPLFEKYSNITITTYQAIFGTLAFIPLMPFETIKFEMINGTIIINLLFLAILCSTMANFAYTYSMKELGIGITSLSLNLIPVVTFLFSFLILKESLNLLQVFGALLIIYSVYMLTKPQKEEVCLEEKEEVLET